MFDNVCYKRVSKTNCLHHSKLKLTFVWKDLPNRQFCYGWSVKIQQCQTSLTCLLRWRHWQLTTKTHFPATQQRAAGPWSRAPVLEYVKCVFHQPRVLVIIAEENLLPMYPSLCGEAGAGAGPGSNWLIGSLAIISTPDVLPRPPQGSHSPQTWERWSTMIVVAASSLRMVKNINFFWDSKIFLNCILGHWTFLYKINFSKKCVFLPKKCILKKWQFDPLSSAAQRQCHGTFF